MDNYNYWRTLEDFLISKREEIVLKRDAKITTQKDTTKEHTPPQLEQKKNLGKRRGPKKTTLNKNQPNQGNLLKTEDRIL